jgi:hypothetical protein
MKMGHHVMMSGGRINNRPYLLLFLIFYFSSLILYYGILALLCMLLRPLGLVVFSFGKKWFGRRKST